MGGLSMSGAVKLLRASKTPISCKANFDLATPEKRANREGTCQVHTKQARTYNTAENGKEK
jgi:hypothetical protein